MVGHGKARTHAHLLGDGNGSGLAHALGRGDDGAEEEAVYLDCVSALRDCVVVFVVAAVGIPILDNLSDALQQLGEASPV